MKRVAYSHGACGEVFLIVQCRARRYNREASVRRIVQRWRVVELENNNCQITGLTWHPSRDTLPRVLGGLR
jgi:hypothetical protein